MSDVAAKISDPSGVLRRLLQARNQAQVDTGRAPQLPQPPPPTPARAAATAIGRAAERLYRLGVQPAAIQAGAVTLAEIPEMLPDSPLVAVLQGPGDAIGVIALCAQTVTALIEVQTLGRVTRRMVDRRKPTRSDAMICADFINALMADLGDEMQGIDGFDDLRGYRYATFLDDVRPLTLMLEDKPYRSLDFQVRLGGAESRDARIFLALPQGGSDERRLTPATASISAPQRIDAPPPAPTGPTLVAALQDAPIEVVGILCRRRISLGELRALAPGKLLTLPRISLDEAKLETRDGQLLGTGKFGEAEGCHAIRLHGSQGARSGSPEAAPLSGLDLHSGLGGDATIPDLTAPDAFRETAAPLAEIRHETPDSALRAASAG